MLNEFLGLPLYAYLIAGGLTLLVGIIIISGTIIIQNNNKKNKKDQEFDILLDMDTTYGEEKNNGILQRWDEYWQQRIVVLNISRYSQNNKLIGREIIIFGLILFTILAILLKNVIAGLVIVLIVGYLFSIILKSMANRESEKIAEQLPGFLFALKANLQAYMTPESAILKIVDNMPSPLREDLEIVKKRILSNGTFSEAIQEMKNKTTSKELKFLCSCILQSTNTGANLENQLSVIQKILEDRRKVNDELNKAVRSASPSIWVASLAIPGLLIGTIIIDPNSREFWFNHPLSWVALIAIGLLYGIGIWVTRNLVEGIKKL